MLLKINTSREFCRWLLPVNLIHSHTITAVLYERGLLAGPQISCNALDKVKRQLDSGMVHFSDTTKYTNLSKPLHLQRTRYGHLYSCFLQSNSQRQAVHPGCFQEAPGLAR
jgi:hypothetical protein